MKQIPILCLLVGSAASAVAVDWNADPVSSLQAKELQENPSAPVPQAAPAPTQASVTCEVSETGFETAKILTQPIISSRYIHGGPSQDVKIGKRILRLGSSGSKIYVFIIDEEKMQTGPAVFHATYETFDGDKATGGFTGKVAMSGYDSSHDRDIAFFCYKTP